MTENRNTEASATQRSDSQNPDVDALLSESLKAQSPESFTWKEPERSPRWWQRAEMEQNQHPQGSPAQAASPGSGTGKEKSRGVRVSTVVFGLICLMLALWVLSTVLFSFYIEPILVALVICTLGGLTLVAAGLRPKPGRRF